VDDSELIRYSRQITLPEIDYEGQEKLRNAKVLIIGIGGLGSPAAMYLASSGVGSLILVDDDEVDLSNLQRQIAHNTQSIGINKAKSAMQTLADLNPEVHINAIPKRLNDTELQKQCEKVDLVLDCTDRFSSRFAINRACVATQTPLVSAAAIRFDGQLSSYSMQPDTPCYQCLYPDGNDEEMLCSENGILAPVVGLMGVAQALEAVKIITGVGENLFGKLMIFDGKNMEFRTLNLSKDNQCPVCA
jgi:molybdopterin-synthase adenylyltransferase